MDAVTFRTDFPEFTDPAVYPDAQINFYLKLSEKMLNVQRFGDVFPFAQELYVAHYMTLYAQNMEAVASGSAPGEMTGPTSSMSVDKVSIGYDTGAATMPGAGFWNLTTYGVQFWQMLMMFGAGGIQL
ncbi:DUF4054 domain-containing protein (plasmid) [Erwinia tracheiphila]|uniref:DUF4054 domain-containing protein n=1 Tax=Erwinia tracheiphila TaxID=65700 RepID=UPI001F435E41|nr:DUF4054 domain-containing protein [Erwinia tracheiphila]UIA94548.1 DUF4054 domain-containing protein [Erwinia tracheiphila]